MIENQINALESVENSYSSYGCEVNKNRMIPHMISGLKPIQKRLLQSFLVLNKNNILNNEVIGHCVGHYSPHSLGGGSISAMTQYWCHDNTALVNGIGSWSSRGFTYSEQAADRYIHSELTEYAKKHLKLWKFSDFYLNELDNEEVVELPLIFNHSLLNGCGTSMGVGVSTSYPQCDFNSMKLAIKEILKGTPIEKISKENWVRPFSYGTYTIDDDSLYGLNYTGRCSISESATIVEKWEGSRKYFEISKIPSSVGPSTVLSKMSNEINMGLIYVEDISTENEIIVKVGREKGIKQITDDELKDKLERMYRSYNTYTMYAVDEDGNVVKCGALKILEKSVKYCLKCYERYLKSQLFSLDKKVLFEKVKGRIRELTKQDDITPELMIKDEELMKMSDNKLTLDILKDFLQRSISSLISKKKDTTELENDIKNIEYKISNLNDSYRKEFIED